MITSLIVAPLWPAYGEALERKDYQWIRSTLYRSILVVSGVSAVLSGALAVFGVRLIHLWVGPSINPSPLLLVGLGLWGMLLSVSTTIAMFLNGLSIVRFQVVIAFVGALANIVLSVYLTLRIGIPGVVYGSVISQIIVGIIPYFWYVQRYLCKARFLTGPVLGDEANTAQ
jgi:O-antigen/teichoic acid export membrane protein